MVAQYSVIQLLEICWLNTVNVLTQLLKMSGVRCIAQHTIVKAQDSNPVSPTNILRCPTNCCSP